MTLYLVSKYDSEGQRLWLYFLLRSALALVNRLTEADAWKLESQPSPWVKDEANGHTVWRHSRGGHVVELLPIKLSFRDWSLRRWIRHRLHWQNLNTRYAGGREIPTGSIFRHGRAWFKPRGYGHPSDLCARLSWHFEPNLSRLVSVGFDFFTGDSEQDVSTHLTLFGWSLYFTLVYILPRKWARRHRWEHSTGFYIVDGSFRVELWHGGDDCYTCEGWKGWYRHIFLGDFFLGRNDYKSEVLETHAALVTMPEGQYPATVTIHRDSWTRRRWPFKRWPRVRLSSRIEVENGVPVPGKGENSWDCGEDAIYSTGSSTPTVAAAVAQITKSALETRERYGGRGWMPSKAQAA